MKRLLAYLFIVLGLGLISNANAAYLYMYGKGKHLNDFDNLEEFLTNSTGWVVGNGKYVKETLRVSMFHNKGKNSTCEELINFKPEVHKKRGILCIGDNGVNRDLYLKLMKHSSKKHYLGNHLTPKGNKLYTRKVSIKFFLRYADLLGNDFKFGENNKSKIAKVEPMQKKPDDNLEQEKKKIAEEKKKIEEEKRKIAEAKKKQEEEDQKRKEANAKLYVIGSGTGFFVSSEGHVVSNDHVVGICRKVATKIEGKIINFNVINTDKVNDLGLIQGEYKSKNFLNIKSGGAEFGEDIVTFGYPLSDDLSDSVKLTRGIVSSLSGPGNNYSEIQIDAAIQPGNSGGPVLNMEGQVVGVASSGLNKITKLLDENSPYIPENVNFAVASPTLTNFLKANGVSVSNASLRISNTKELAKIGRPATLQLFCMNTKAVHEELKKTKKHSDVLLEKVIELR
jgi:hypothetical protein